jgi:hypothetical protein
MLVGWGSWLHYVEDAHETTGMLQQMYCACVWLPCILRCLLFLNCQVCMLPLAQALTVNLPCLLYTITCCAHSPQPHASGPHPLRVTPAVRSKVEKLLAAKGQSFEKEVIYRASQAAGRRWCRCSLTLPSMLYCKVYCSCADMPV